MECSTPSLILVTTIGRVISRPATRGTSDDDIEKTRIKISATTGVTRRTDRGNEIKFFTLSNLPEKKPISKPARIEIEKEASTRKKVAKSCL